LTWKHYTSYLNLVRPDISQVLLHCSRQQLSKALGTWHKQLNEQVTTLNEWISRHTQHRELSWAIHTWQQIAHQEELFSTSILHWQCRKLVLSLYQWKVWVKQSSEEHSLRHWVEQQWVVRELKWAILVWSAYSTARGFAYEIAMVLADAFCRWRAARDTFHCQTLLSNRAILHWADKKQASAFSKWQEGANCNTKLYTRSLLFWIEHKLDAIINWWRKTAARQTYLSTEKTRLHLSVVFHYWKEATLRWLRAQILLEEAMLKWVKDSLIRTIYIWRSALMQGMQRSLY